MNSNGVLFIAMIFKQVLRDNGITHFTGYFQFWNDTQPDGGIGQNCGYIRDATYGGWGDNGCFAAYPYICKMVMP